jgi:hypothetical protein
METNLIRQNAMNRTRGRGRLQKAIEAAFRQNPSKTYSVEELAPIAYPELGEIEKKHRVAILRAASAASEACGWCYRCAERPGHPMIYGNPTDLRSYATWHMRLDCLTGDMAPDQLATAFDDPNDAAWKRVQPGGAWWCHVEIYNARAAGDAERAKQVEEELAASIEAMRRAPLHRLRAA